MALPTKGITTTLVGNELGVSTRNVGNLCRAESINKWSAHKPVRFNKEGGITLANLQSVTFGLGIPAALNANIDILSQAWSYLRPRGVVYSEPYRLGDFRNYEHLAKVPFVISIPDTFLANASNPSIGICRLLTTNDNMDVTEIFPGKYFGVMVFPDSASGERLYKTADAPGLSSISLKDCPHSVAGATLSVYAFMSDSEIPEWIGLPYQVIYSLNGENNMSWKSVSVTGPPMLNEEWIDVTGINVRQWTEPINLPSGISATAVLLNPISGTKTATTVTVRARRNSDNGLVYSKTYPSNFYVEPQSIDQFDYNVGDTIGFSLRPEDFPVDQTLPTLPWNDYYDITYTINYV